MIGLRRPLGLLVVLSAAVVPATAGPADELDDLFQQGATALERGRQEDALKAMRRVLAMDPDQERALDLWQSTDNRVWLRMLTAGGELERIAQDLVTRVREGRREKRDDADAIRELVAQLDSSDMAARERSLRALAATHGSFAVPYILPALADQVNDDKRIDMMTALARMGDDVVPALLEAMDSEDPFQRRNIALTLGQIGDSRACGRLAAAAAKDADGSVRQAATEAVQRIGCGGNAVTLLVQEGMDYHLERDTVLRPHQYSDVVWTWTNDRLTYTTVPAYLYPDEMAKKAFQRALAVDPSSSAALAGIARVSASERARVAAAEAAGEEVDDAVRESIELGMLAMQAAGPQALDRALQASVESGDEGTAIELAQALAELAAQPTQGLRAALQSRSARLSNEAAVALGTIAYRTGSAAGPEVIANLVEAAGREVLRLVMVIDGNTSRASAIAANLEGRRIHPSLSATGAIALSSLRRVPGIDAILIADSLPDLTTFQVLREVRRDPRLAETPVLVIAEDAEAARENFTDAAAVITGPEDLSELDGVFSESMGTDRSQALDLARRAAETMSKLARSGNSSFSGSLDQVAGSLDGRPDEVAIPLVDTLAAVGSGASISKLLMLVEDGERSVEVREAAANALGEIFGRDASAGGDAMNRLAGLVGSSDAPPRLRAATARALGRLSLADPMRAELVRNLGMATAGK